MAMPMITNMNKVTNLGLDIVDSMLCTQLKLFNVFSQHWDRYMFCTEQ